MKTIWIATRNEGKVSEFREMFSKLGYQVKSLNDLAEPVDIEETGDTFEENARIKSETLSEMLQEPVLADDSGLVIDSLNGSPGVYSARYAGNHKSDADNMQKVLDELKDTPEEERTARFICVLAISRPNHKTEFLKGTCEGEIASEPAGENGFGYDPIFYLPERKKTMAQLSQEEKSKISHRGNAIKQLEKNIRELF
ncbi:XTP/dITP diphosphatase [Virgibacillus sp. MSP4-1]|uniref:XTP/dITP diphosphatase n=1 Tax=Virgibacillus sp. MSP4-1 TaxID=2700081 RepID=UPI0003A4EAB2|nr:XTP/dITP diphosphatase [Virgibacillus sp. MSP4-1]QHS23408.1 XTP/dITP diphosphatase [Virgibacillus sp. MSP4-1]